MDCGTVRLVGSQSQRAYAVVAEAGYRLDQVAWKPWLRFGYTVGSGDNNPKDGTLPRRLILVDMARVTRMVLGLA